MVRLTPSLVREVDAHAKYLGATLGLHVSRASAVRMLLAEALAEVRAKREKKK